MRTLFEIIEAAKIGEPTTHEECLYALLAYASLAYFDEHALRQLAFQPSKFLTAERQAEESHRRWKTALDKSPKDWLGPNNDPATEECRKRVRMARAIFDKVLAQAPSTNAVDPHAQPSGTPGPRDGSSS
jgi:hypothetical protein